MVVGSPRTATGVVLAPHGWSASCSPRLPRRWGCARRVSRPSASRP